MEQRVDKIAFGLHLSISLETGPKFDLFNLATLMTVSISETVILK